MAEAGAGAIAQAVEVLKNNAIAAEQTKLQKIAADEENLRNSNAIAAAEEKARLEEARQQQVRVEESSNKAAHAEKLQKRIGMLLEAVDAASQGDLDYPIDRSVADDDLGMIAVALDELFGQLRNSFADIENSAGSVSQAAIESVNGAAEQLSDHASVLQKLLQRYQPKDRCQI